MTMLLCSQNDLVIERWANTLEPRWQTFLSSSVEHLSSLCVQFKVDIMFLHRSMVNGEQLKKICDQSGGFKVFVLSDRPNDAEGAVCLKLGCVGYANTYMSPNQMVAAIEAIEAGKVWVGKSLMQFLIKGLSTEKNLFLDDHFSVKSHAPLEKLSKREYQLASLIAEGMKNSEIAAELAISEHTVKTHLSSIYSKLNVNDRLNLALLINGEDGPTVH